MTATIRCQGGGFCRQRPQGYRDIAAGRPHCGQSGGQASRARLQREQIPQRATASGIWHSQHKLCAVSIFGLLSSKKENGNG
ncbi:hypothetical protein TUM17554_15090 [Klebsiella pneumoniae]|nr:hypothetical protein TUM17554_15090 [Klebsiella pneumoniae]